MTDQPSTDLVQRRELLQDATAELLDAVSAFMARYVVPPSEDALFALSLWALHSWVLDVADCTPYLLITSKEPGAGKSRLLEVLSYVVRQPWMTAQTTQTVLFRKMAAERPTLLMDEVDAVFRGGSSNEGLRAVLNSGNRQGGYVDRCDGKWGTVRYGTYGAKALSGIDNGFLPATIVDRSISIAMQKQKGQVARLRPRQAASEAAPLRYTLDAWAGAVGEELAQIEPELPSTLSDRAADGWEPLLAIGSFAGEDWSERAQKAAVALSGSPAESVDPLLPAMAKAIAPMDLEAAEQYAYERRETNRAKRAELQSREGFVSRVNCGVCGRFKSAPADVCPYCGDAPLQHNGDAHEFNRAYGAPA